MLYELVVAFAIGFITGMIYEAERVSRMVATEKGLKQFLLAHAPWHLRKIQPEKEKRVVVRRESGIGYLAKLIILAMIILMILSVSGLL